jgi:hypothetical protein
MIKALDAAHDQKGESRHDVADADLLVIDGRNPAVEAGLGLAELLELARERVARRRDFRSSDVFSDGHS